MTNPTSTDISTIKLWFERAVPEPTGKNQAVQIGVHIEEFTEMLDAIGVRGALADDLRSLAIMFKQDMGDDYNALSKDNCMTMKNRSDLLDALCDQIVTAVGVAHMLGMDISGALSEVNRSNWSKFVEGQPVFNEHGKIAKGPNYTPPDLTRFL